MVGGAGNDFLYGGSARDVLIGGTGLGVLLGNGDGDMLIGSSTADLRNRLNTTTVIDDMAADILWGSNGLAWYFAEPKKSTRDIVYSNAGELVEALL